MTPSSEQPALIDANVLVYAFYSQSQHHQTSLDLLDQAQDADAALHVAPQVLAEFYAVITDGRRVDPPFQPAEALDAIENVLALPGITLLPVPIDVVNRWIALARQQPVKRGAIFDLQLVATMVGNGVTKLYTYDVSDFQPFPAIEAVEP